MNFVMVPKHITNKSLVHGLEVKKTVKYWIPGHSNIFDILIVFYFPRLVCEKQIETTLYTYLAYLAPNLPNISTYLMSEMTWTWYMMHDRYIRNERPRFQKQISVKVASGRHQRPSVNILVRWYHQMRSQEMSKNTKNPHFSAALFVFTLLSDESFK